MNDGTGSGECGLTRREWLTAGAGAIASIAPGTNVIASGKVAIGSKPGFHARLSLNENPFGPSPLAWRAIRDQLGEVCRYTGGEAETLIQAIGKRENISSRQIVLGEILEALGLHLAMSGPAGGEFIYSEPGYTALVDAVSPGGGVVVGVPLDGRLENDLPAIAAKVNGRTRAVYLVNPHNPTGTVSDADRFLDFTRDLSRRTTIIVDEAYLEFAADFSRRTVAGLTRNGENVVVFRTFGKMYGLAGLAMGYALAPEPLAASLANRGIGAPRSLNRLALAAAAGSLADDGYVSSVRGKVVIEPEKWNRLLDVLKLERADSHGNFVFFRTGRPHASVAAAMLAKGVEVARAFSPLDDWVRISIGLPEENQLARDAIAALLG